MPTDTSGGASRSPRSVGDVHLEGLCLLNHAEVHVARQRFEEARGNAEAALAIFDRLDTRIDKADVYKVLGVVYRETGRHALAESRLRAAIDQAVGTGSVLSEAEASRELARLYQMMGRNQEALRLLSAAHSSSGGWTRGWTWWTWRPRSAGSRTPIWRW